jgi:dienelactone hydrolase
MIAVILSAVLSQADGESLARREAYLEVFQRMVTPSAEWTVWQEETGELPPDWEAMPMLADLPSPLSRWTGEAWTAIDSAAEWPAHRAALLEQFKYWVMGSWPDAPGPIAATLIEESVEPDGTRREYELRFGPENKATLWVQLLIPPGDGPFPVFLTQHNHRAWARIAMRRGYLGVVYAGSDSRDDTASFVDAYPGYDWSKLTRRAWAASRSIDFLEEHVPVADTERIAMTGHSRNGKMSLFASAMDERIGVVISSSSGTGGPLPSRLHSEQHFAEGIENITRNFPDWFHPRWRYFTGQEHRMPIDFHQLTGLTAPRACLLAIGVNDGVEGTWAMERAYLALKPAWALHDATDALRIEYRAGGHENSPFVIERYLDWCDRNLGRGDYAFPERMLYPHNWQSWQAMQEAVDVNDFPERPWSATPERLHDRDALATVVRWALGEPVPGVRSENDTYGTETAHEETLLRRSGTPQGLTVQDVMFGEYLDADVYAPTEWANDGRRHPAVLWLHPRSNALGFVPSYRRGGLFHHTVARAGFVTFCFDQLGHGGRVLEPEFFHERYPDASQLGVMVRDARAALDSMNELPSVDPNRIYVVGYGLGAMVALHLSAIDERPAGFVLLSPPAPFRLDTDPTRTGGLRRWTHQQMLVPRLGYFAGQENRLPYDIDDLLAGMAPKPVRLIAGEYDRESPPELLSRAVEAARHAAPAGDAWLTLDAPEAYAHFDERMQGRVIDWLRDQVAE